MSQSTTISTTHITLDPENFDESVLQPAANSIRGGGLVIFPTETVYGLGGDATNEESADKIYAAKGRPSDNPLIIISRTPRMPSRIALRLLCITGLPPVLCRDRSR